MEMCSGMFIAEPRSWIQILSIIQDPGVKEALDSGSRSATLLVQRRKIFLYMTWMIVVVQDA